MKSKGKVMKSKLTWLIVILIWAALGWILAADANALTARVTWNVVTDSDLRGYQIIYRVDQGAWHYYKETAADALPQKNGRTGRHLTAPDNGKVYRVVLLSVDDSGNRSDATATIVIDTFNRLVYVEPGTVSEDTLPEPPVTVL